MWIRKDVAGIYAAMPAEQALPLVATILAVSLAKVALLTGGILLAKWILGKFKKLD